MRVRRSLLGCLLLVGPIACGDDGGPDESYACADGSTLEVLRPDAPDSDGNVARARRTGESPEEFGKVDESELEALIALCTGQ